MNLRQYYRDIKQANDPFIVAFFSTTGALATVLPAYLSLSNGVDRWICTRSSCAISLIPVVPFIAVALYVFHYGIYRAYFMEKKIKLIAQTLFVIDLFSVVILIQIFR